MSRKYAVGDDGRLISSNDIPFDWEVLQISKQAVADIIEEVSFDDDDALLKIVASEDVMCVADIIPLHEVPLHELERAMRRAA